MRLQSRLWIPVPILAALVSLSGCTASSADPSRTGSPIPSPEPSEALNPIAASDTPPISTRWSALDGEGSYYRAVHMGGNWGTTSDGGATELPEEYFDWLRDTNVNWVGISVALHLDSTMDASVERRYEGVAVPTFRDDTLRSLIGAFRERGFHVYLTLAFEDPDEPAADYVHERWMLGDPAIYDETDIPPEDWPWAVEHEDHEAFVAEFWNTYTEQAVFYGLLAEAEGVELYSLGTETDRLFRTRPLGGVGPNDFGDEIVRMVGEVRSVYSGLVTYDMSHFAVIDTEFYGSAPFLWSDAGFDVIGISAYFQLVDAPLQTVPSIPYLETAWEAVFENYLMPVRERNPGTPILFTEFGYTDSLNSPFQPSSEEFTEMRMVDGNGNGIDDGRETQANIYQALFNVMDREPGILQGAFLWGHMMADNEHWKEFFGAARGFAVRGKAAEEVVRQRYSQWIHAP
jgi:hypothetical protein